MAMIYTLCKTIFLYIRGSSFASKKLLKRNPLMLKNNTTDIIGRLSLQSSVRRLNEHQPKGGDALRLGR